MPAFLTVLATLRQFVSWVFLKLLFGLFIATGALAIHALWLFDRQEGSFEDARTAHLVLLQNRLKEAEVGRAAAKVQLEGQVAELAATQERAVQATRLADELEEMQSIWDRFFGNRDQWKLTERRLERLRAMAGESKGALARLRSGATRAEVLLARAQREHERAREAWTLCDQAKNPVWYYAVRSWLEGRWIYALLVGLYLLGPPLHRVGVYYHFAPRIAKRRPLRLAKESGPFPWLGEISSTVDVALWPGEQARVRRRFLESFEEGLSVRPRLLFSWRYPLTSLLSGVVHDIEIRNVRAGHDYRVSFAHRKNPDHQLAVVHVPEGGSLVVRPSFVAGVILPPSQRLKLRRRWQLLRWQAWLAGQLRYMEFVGPCRLVIAGRPGLRMERLTTGEEDATPTCRAVLDKVIGFSPSLEYRLVRTARFWTYYRRSALLFDANFSGVGVVLVQTAIPGRRYGLLTSARHQARRLLGL